MLFPEAQSTSDPSGAQQIPIYGSLGEVSSGALSQPVAFPTADHNESMYGGRARAPSSLFAAGSRIAGASH
jgi:hypothetical protein